MKSENVIITGEINSSDDAEEELNIETPIGNNFEQILSPEEVKNPDVLLINNPSLIINMETFIRCIQSMTKNLSDHFAHKTQINLNQTLIETKSNKNHICFEKSRLDCN